MSDNARVYNKRSNVKDKSPVSTDLEYGEIAINYNADNEKLYIKNDKDEVVSMPISETVDGSRLVGTLNGDLIRLDDNTKTCVGEGTISMTGDDLYHIEMQLASGLTVAKRNPTSYANVSATSFSIASTNTNLTKPDKAYVYINNESIRCNDYSLVSEDDSTTPPPYSTLTGSNLTFTNGTITTNYGTGINFRNGSNIAVMTAMGMLFTKGTYEIQILPSIGLSSASGSYSTVLQYNSLKFQNATTAKIYSISMIDTGLNFDSNCNFTSSITSASSTTKELLVTDAAGKDRYWSADTSNGIIFTDDTSLNSGDILGVPKIQINRDSGLYMDCNDGAQIQIMTPNSNVVISGDYIQFGSSDSGMGVITPYSISTDIIRSAVEQILKEKGLI